MKHRSCCLIFSSREKQLHLFDCGWTRKLGRRGKKCGMCIIILIPARLNQNLLLAFVVDSQAGGSLGGHHPAGEERHPPAARRHQGEHPGQRARLLRLPQHQRDLQVGRAACQHCHASAAGQQGLRTGPLTSQAQEEVAQESVGAKKVREKNIRRRGRNNHK